MPLVRTPTHLRPKVTPALELGALAWGTAGRLVGALACGFRGALETLATPL